MKEKEKIKRDEYQKVLEAFSLAMKSFRKGEFDKAEEQLKEFLEKHTSETELIDRAKAYLAVCDSQLRKEKVQLKTFEDYLQHSIVKINRKDYEGALKLLEKAREMSPKDGKVPYLVADIYCRTGQTEMCLDHLKTAIQLDGFLKILAQNDTDFGPLWEDKKFKLITRMA
jgi:tetratricopeptide (TPR) repeat protein